METQPSKLILWQYCGETVGVRDANRNGYFPAQFNSSERLSSDTMHLSLIPNLSWNRPCIMPLVSIPNVDEGSSMANIILMGTAIRGGTGPSVGAVDIGASRTANYFRVALPGVKKDPGQFSCEIERDGKVHVCDVTTTGENFVSRHTRVFEMKVQQQCPPGPFSAHLVRSRFLSGYQDLSIQGSFFRTSGLMAFLKLL